MLVEGRKSLADRLETSREDLIQGEPELSHGSEVKKLGTFHGCSSASRIVPESHSGNTSSSTESSGNDLYGTERAWGRARVFHQEQTAV